MSLWPGLVRLVLAAGRYVACRTAVTRLGGGDVVATSIVKMRGVTTTVAG